VFPPEINEPAVTGRGFANEELTGGDVKGNCDGGGPTSLPTRAEKTARQVSRDQRTAGRWNHAQKNNRRGSRKKRQQKGESGDKSSENAGNARTHMRERRWSSEQEVLVGAFTRGRGGAIKKKR